jgi:hypothetical protein
LVKISAGFASTKDGKYLGFTVVAMVMVQILLCFVVMIGDVVLNLSWSITLVLSMDWDGCLLHVLYLTTISHGWLISCPSLISSELKVKVTFKYGNENAFFGLNSPKRLEYDIPFHLSTILGGFRASQL